MFKILNEKNVLIILSIFLITFVFLSFIQNSSEKRKVNFLMNETVKLPVSFIVGISFISGSLSGGLLSLNSNEERN